jgi:gamma-polyglutamate biosynthesis protein CapA
LKTQKSDKNKITIIAVGDIMLGDLPTCYGFGVGSTIEKRGPAFPFAHCAETLKKGDITCGNLETVISRFDRQNDPFNKIVLRAQPEVIESLKGAGFNLLTLGNNHIMQHGRQALIETVELLKASQIGIIGLEIPENNILNRVVYNINGSAICFLGYNQRPLQYFLDPPLYVDFDIDKIKTDIEKSRKEADIVVLSLHWGDEFVDIPSRTQIETAHQLIDSGADIILGHHSHQIQGVEKYKGKIIAYSLGNFVFDMWQRRLRNSMILKIEISAGSNLEYSILPAIISPQYQPRIAESQEGEALTKYIAKISNDLNHDLSDTDYEALVARELARYRKEVYWHYFTSIHRFSPRRLATNFIGAIARRLPGRSH